MTGAVTCSAADLIAQATIAFRRARETAGGHEIDLTFGGRPIRISVAGSGLRDVFVRALAGGPAAPAMAPTLTVRAWDGRSSGAPIEIPPSLFEQAGRLGLVESLCDDRYRVMVSSAVAIADLRSGQAFYYVPDPEQLPYWETAHPARVVFAAWAQRAGLRMCHAAAVGVDGHGILVVGSGGSGKSTTALACLGAGMRCAGDDYVLVETEPVPRAHSLYASTLLRPDHQERFPVLMPRVDNRESIEEGAKAMMFAEPGAMSGGFELRAVAVPRVRGSGDWSLRPISAARALRALAPSSILQLGAFDAEALPCLGALCRALPCLELTLGADVTEIPAAVTEALRLTVTGEPVSR